jgi:hypothetical protein
MLVITGVCIIWMNKLVILKDITSFKMILDIEFIGGLGNALFQFAFIYSCALKHACQFTIPNLDTWSSPHQTVSYAWFIDMVKSCPNYTTPGSNFKDYYTEHHPFIYRPVQVTCNTLFRGYYQCVSYIHPDVYPLVRACLPRIDQIDDAIFIHIRLGDYTSIPETKLDDTYYTRAIQLFPSVELHVFSDDIEGAKHIVNCATQYIDCDEVVGLAMMSKYTLGGICANSSFSWWASQLNNSPCKRIVMPKVWGRLMPDDPIDLYPPNVILV